MENKINEAFSSTDGAIVARVRGIFTRRLAACVEHDGIRVNQLRMMPRNEIDVNTIYVNDIKVKKKDVQDIMEWVKQQLHLPEVSELQTALFLHSCYYNNEITKMTIDTYFTMKTSSPDIFGTRDPRDHQVQLSMECMLIYPLPKLCPNGELVILAKLMDDNSENFNFPVLIRCFDMITLSYLHENGPPDGLIILFDMDGINFSHFLKLSIVIMKKLLYYLQEGMPIRLKGLHFCNIVSFMDKVLAMMKPFMKQELVNSLFLHTKMDTVYDYVPKIIFPEDYGGVCESLQILHGKYKEQMYSNQELFEYQELQLVDESKRIGDSVEMGDVFGMVGTFKRLELD